DEVTEPHVAHFVHNGRCPGGILRYGRSGSKNIGFVKRHETRIFHCPEVVFGYKRLVIFTPWICNLELFMKPRQPSLSLLKERCGVNMVNQGLPGKDPQIDRFGSGLLMTVPDIYKLRIRPC